MSFHRDKEKAHRWQTWLQQHRAELEHCGVPHFVLDDQSYWLYFLDHGCYVPPGNATPVIDVDHMNSADVERLCLFLENDDLYPGSVALNRLQYLLKRGKHSKKSD